MEERRRRRGRHRERRDLYNDFNLQLVVNEDGAGKFERRTDEEEEEEPSELKFVSPSSLSNLSVLPLIVSVLPRPLGVWE